MFEKIEQTSVVPKEEKKVVTGRERNVFDFLVLGILYSLVGFLLIAGFYLFVNLKRFEDYNSLKVLNLGEKEARLRIDGLSSSYFVVRPDETLKLKVRDGMILDVDNPAGMLRIMLGNKAWEIRMKRFILDVKYGRSEGG